MDNIQGPKIISQEEIGRIWENGKYRVFLSHLAEFKKETATLKKELGLYGIFCFVAHEDIQPTQKWQDEIENALKTMDVLVALITVKFHESLWTNQEIGFAFGHDVPIIPVRLGIDPCGLIGKFQALSCTWETAAEELVKLLIKYDRMLDCYISAVAKCPFYDDATKLGKILPHIDRCSNTQVQAFIAAYNNNGQIYDSYAFNGTKPKFYGDGLAYHLERMTGRKFQIKQHTLSEA